MTSGKLLFARLWHMRRQLQAGAVGAALLIFAGLWAIDRYTVKGQKPPTEGPPVQGKTIQLDLSSLVNLDLTGYTNGPYYPLHGGPLTVAGVPFTLATIGPSSHTAVFQSPGDPAWSHLIPVNATGVSTVYTLINSSYGACGTTVGELDFEGTTSKPFVYPLTEGINIRDHGDGHFCNTVKNLAGTAGFGGGAVRLDMQRITLPASFATDTLLSITFKTYGLGSAYGAPFLTAITAIQP